MAGEERGAYIVFGHGVAELVLNRPEKINAMNAAMVDDIHKAFSAAEEAGVRALIVRGEGKGFSAGRDLSESDPLNEDAHAILADLFNPVFARAADFPAPTLAAVQGACLGTGLGLALACDLVFAADDARIGSPFARIGAVLDSGAHNAFFKRIGSHRALELIYTGRLLSGRDASDWGLVNRSVARLQLLPTVRALAKGIAAGPTAAFMASKRIIRRLDEEAVGFTEVMAAEADAQGEAARTHDYAEGITAFLAKRSPAFEGQ